MQDGATFAAGVRPSGAVTVAVTVERGAYIGAGALVRENVVGAGAIMGMSAVVTRVK